jgi:prolyl 4-hydroxylase
MVKLWQSLAAAVNVQSVLAVGDAQLPLSGSLASAEYKCTDVPYKMHVFSNSPLVMYLENFITAEERIHLQNPA